jgi:hypothetical protein
MLSPSSIFVSGVNVTDFLRARVGMEGSSVEIARSLAFFLNFFEMGGSIESMFCLETQSPRETQRFALKLVCILASDLIFARRESARVKSQTAW